MKGYQVLVSGWPRNLVLFTLLTAFVVWGGEAQAAGTVAGTTVTNQVTVNYQVGGVAQTPVSATATFVVDDRVDLTVTNNGNATVTPGSNDQVLPFTLTNTGNATHGYLLTTSLGAGTFAMNNVRIYVDVDQSGTLNGVDTLYTPGTNVGDIAPDAFIRLLIVSDTPAGAVDGQLRTYNLIATTTNAGTATPTVEDNSPDVANAVQVVFGDGLGTDDGNVDGAHSAGGTYSVLSATFVISKTSAVLNDPLNGVTNPKRIPGALVRYTITIENTGAAAADAVVASDPVPADTTYVAGTITLNGGAQTDISDADASDFGVTTPGAVTVNVGTIPSGALPVNITFDVTVD
jgi:uncharacterized repeat protein (TIGR01451 family)